MDSVPLVDAAKSACGEGQRRVRTSAAAIGLAISMGAVGLALPKPSSASVVSESNDKTREAPDLPPEDALQTHEAIEQADVEAGAADSLASALMVPSIDKTVVIPGEAEASQEQGSNSALPQEPVASASPAALESEYIQHIVREGQTLWHIASAYRVDLRDIVSENNLPSGYDLRVGEMIRIPVREGMNRSPEIDIVVDASEFSASRKALDKDLDVRGFSENGLRGGAPDAKSEPVADTEEERVAYVSPLLDNAPEAGALELLPGSHDGAAQIAALPAPELSLPIQLAPTLDDAGLNELAALPESAPIVSPAHRVTRGDTLYAIAARHGVTVEALVETNSLSNPNVLTPGQELVLPLTPTDEPDSNSPTVALLPDSAEDAQSIALPMTPFVAEPAERVAALSRRDRAIASSPADLPVAQAAVSELPAAPTEIALAESTAESSELSAAYASSLREDIERVRARQLDTIAAVPVELNDAVTVSAAPSPPALAPSREMASVRINPEFSARESVREAAQAAALSKPDDAAESVVQAPTVAPDAPLVARAEASDADGDELLAVAPIGASNYAPVLPPRSASPDLPGLAAVGEYLPEAGTPMGDMDGYVWPAHGVLTSGYGWRWGRMHNGIDIGAPTGTPIFAAAPGVVTYARWNSGGYGNLVEITHPDGSLTLYAHNSRNVVEEGEVVEQGQHIADMGSTGFSTGPHLHFELHAAGLGAVDPVAYLQ
ncbi:MAG: peptidoglycan DD-metalloendopeptidase family protein [Geitlerinemataceae cyanobacterium]